ncbi:hypothetical protein Cgig2_009050 [Carnegiea gigantea]|uniref:DUF8040 domain-containing protein n=1 Tax=Carnegiea gigantea TaxID=171969 RepID=A0A9Q1QL06_9CARY|nr:hypothetical protein Cgig2_009050 [Carnegiea gigantea]
MCVVACRDIGKYKSFRKKVPVNLEKMKSAFYGKQATGKMSFTPGMVAPPSNQTQRLKRKEIDMDEHVGDSDEANEDGSDVDIECLCAEESRSPPKSVHSSHKRKSEGGTSSDGKRQELLNWSSRDEEVHQLLAILRMREEAKQQPSLTKIVQWMKKKTMHAIDTIVDYTLQCYHMDRPCSTLKERLPRAIGGESGVQYIYRLFSGNRPDLCRKILRLDKDVCTHLVGIFMERRLLKEGCFVKAAKIVVITRFILVRGASYQEAEDRFQHSPLTIGKYHKQVLDGLVQLSSDIIRPYQSQDELPAEILQKKGFYWPF